MSLRTAVLWLIPALAGGQGRIVFDSSSGNGVNEDLFAINPDGTDLEQLTHTTGRAREPEWIGRASRLASWSPDFRRIVFASNRDDGGKLDIYVMDADGGNIKRLTHEPGIANITSVWSPDGDRIAFSRWNPETQIDSIFTMYSDGSDIRRLTPETISAEYPSWSPDGRVIAFTGRSADAGYDKTGIYVIGVDGSGLLRLTDGMGDQAPDWSPDGSRIAFDSTRDGNFEIYVMNADGSGQERLTTHFNVDSRPSWSPDGKRIVFNSTRHALRKTEENPEGWSAMEIYVMDADGSNVRRLTFNDKFDGHPDW